MEWEKKIKEIGKYLGCNEKELWNEMSIILEEQKKTILKEIHKEFDIDMDFGEKGTSIREIINNIK